jgi:ABC-type multidrug transport system ATPase subunit
MKKIEQEAPAMG